MNLAIIEIPEYDNDSPNEDPSVSTATSTIKKNQVNLMLGICRITG